MVEEGTRLFSAVRCVISKLQTFVWDLSLSPLDGAPSFPSSHTPGYESVTENLRKYQIRIRCPVAQRSEGSTELVFVAMAAGAGATATRPPGSGTSSASGTSRVRSWRWCQDKYEMAVTSPVRARSGFSHDVRLLLSLPCGSRLSDPAISLSSDFISDSKSLNTFLFSVNQRKCVEVACR